MMERAIVQLPDWKCAIVNGVKGTIDDVESILITGNCDIPEYSFCGLKNLKCIEIADDVTGINKHAFENCDALETVHFGKGLQFIGENAFFNCNKLEELTIPGNVKTISGYTFFVLRGLKKLTIEEGVESIGHMAFFRCRNLENVVVPQKSVQHLGGYVFDESKWLSSQTGPVMIGEVLAYYRGGGDSIVIPDYVRVISSDVIRFRGIREIDLGKGVKCIGSKAFQTNEHLETVIMHEGLIEIGDNAFAGNLRNVKAPDSLLKVGAYSLWPHNMSDCPELGCVYAGKALIGCMGDSKRAEIKEGTYSISPHAFDSKYKLETIILPSSIREINCSFTSCTHLSMLLVPRGVPASCLNAFSKIKGITIFTWRDSDADQFAKENGISIVYLEDNISQEELIKQTTKRRELKAAKPLKKRKSSPAEWFRRTGNAIAGLSREGIKEIHSKKIKSISLPLEKDGLQLERLVPNCLTDLKEVPEVEELVIPGELKIQGLTTTSGRDCWDFPNSETIKRLMFTGKTEINFYLNIKVFDNSLESITIQNSDRFISIDGVIYSKDGKSLVLYPRSKKDRKFVVPESVTAIWGSAFRDVKYLEELILPEGLKTIHKDAFKGSSIKKIENPSCVTQSPF